MVSRSFVEVSALVVAAALACTAPLAGAALEPLTRAQVAAETLAAAKAHQLQPAGEGSPRFEPSAFQSGKTHADIKSETLRAIRAGDLTPAGEGVDSRAERIFVSGQTTKTRAEVNAETRAAAKAGQLTPAGEGGATSR